MEIGLFGGTFNPPHLGHLILAEAVRDALGLDRVLWMPAAIPPHKQDGVEASAEDRLEMTRLAAAGHPAFHVSDLEIRRTGVSYTVDTLRHLQETHPADGFWLILGGDSLAGFESWREPDEIVARARLAVHHRPGADVTRVAPRWLARTRFVEAPLIGISSTDIRARCRAGRSIRFLVPEPVRAYIETHGLYLDQGPGA